MSFFFQRSLIFYELRSFEETHEQFDHFKVCKTNETKAILEILNYLSKKKVKIERRINTQHVTYSVF